MSLNRALQIADNCKQDGRLSLPKHYQTSTALWALQKLAKVCREQRDIINKYREKYEITR